MRGRTISVLVGLVALVLASGVAIAGSVLVVPSDGPYTACYDGGGNVKLIDPAVTPACPKGWSGPIAWSETGPAGPQGEAGVAGATGPRGEPGPAIASIDDLDGVACGSGESAGQIDVIYGTDATVSLRCVPALVRLTVRAYFGGTVTSTPAGIDCTGDATCSYLFPRDAQVTLTGSPISTYRGPTWSGVCAALPSGTPCQLTLTEAASVTAGWQRVCEGPAPTGLHANYTCVNGSWTLVSCQSGWGNCNGSPGDGCEADLLFGEACCGTCGRACQPGTTCQYGTCVAP